MSARRGLLIVLILIAMLIGGALVSAHAQIAIMCQDGVCFVPQQLLELMVQKLQACKGTPA